jgi:PPM family protein phosphatase
MGGAEAGEVASRLVVESTCRELSGADLDQPEDSLRSAVERANFAVWNAAQQNPKWHGMGATLVAAWILGSEVLIADVGDSRVYLLRAGRMRQVTRDQSMVETLVEAGKLAREMAEQHPQKNVILQAMGVQSSVVVAIERVELRRGDFLLLCSDGLSGKISAEEMRDCILTTATLGDACSRMVSLAKARGGEDNITIIVAELDGEGLPEATLNERMTRTLQSVSGFNFKAGGGYAPPPAPKPTVTLGSDGAEPAPRTPQVYPPDPSPSPSNGATAEKTQLLSFSEPPPRPSDEEK